MCFGSVYSFGADKQADCFTFDQPSWSFLLKLPNMFPQAHQHTFILGTAFAKLPPGLGVFPRLPFQRAYCHSPNTGLSCENELSPRIFSFKHHSNFLKSMLELKRNSEDNVPSLPLTEHRGERSYNELPAKSGSRTNPPYQRPREFLLSRA